MRSETVLTKLNAWRPQLLQRRLPLLADSTASRESISMNRPADQIALLGTRIHRAIRAAAAGTTDDWALDAVLTRIFARPPVSRMQVEELLGPEVVDELIQIGVLVREGRQRVRLRLALRLVSGNLIVTDLPRSFHSLPSDYVDPLWEAPVLAQMLLQGNGGDALDMGSGSGVLALVYAASGGRVYGADLNPRALALSNFNAALNGRDSLTFTRSDLFEAYGDQTFDRIVFNAPVGHEFAATDLLRAGEGILESFFRQIPERLAPGGVAQVNLCGMDWGSETFLARMDRWLGPLASQFQYVFLEQKRVERGRWFAMHRMRGTLSTRRNCFACKAIVRGWLTLRRTPGRPSWSVATNYHDWIAQEAVGSGTALIQALLDASAAGARNLDSTLSPPLQRVLDSARRIARAYDS